MSFSVCDVKTISTLSFTFKTRKEKTLEYFNVLLASNLG